MTTMERLANINVTINFVLPMECMTLDDIIAMGEKETKALFDKLNKKMLNCTASQVEEDLFRSIDYYYDQKYYFDNIDAFHEYQSHMGEPNFDWDFYSDWHKDMYGFRPH